MGGMGRDGRSVCVIELVRIGWVGRIMDGVYPVPNVVRVHS